MKIASLQVQINDSETAADRMKKVDAQLEHLHGYDFILLPEIWMTGYNTFNRYMEEAEPLDGAFAAHYAKKAKTLHAYLFAGSFVEKSGSQYYNTSLLFNREGERIAAYRKIHLFTYGSEEGELLTRGTDPVTVETEFGKVGLATCYDLRFPEQFRKALDRGAKMFLVTSAWPLARLEHWKLFNAARAVENQCYLVSCNCVGNNQGVILGGHSRVVDPWGNVLATGDETESIVTAAFDLSMVDQIREDFPQLKHRVPIN
ncbi:carbon-nitrogen family hydrolase [Sporolactobacillus inulinus]|uniref:Predicted amidohydrolase n=2 Tax=Sporolactobacillus inulinus TaxID=2078 RepID=A0A4Y1ZCG9_9BACL|nr:carbon-nitrogen family hydrolase [Sporolactobacillus inulinus]KLI02063.1 acyltransferase [Sporolactobacillus inulinus CASD]GAY76745.1 predicted amidohydrolase [Sporolactobacillus inulinus]GEB77473.1 hydrolase [Sporolactobacillus inulinus]